VVPGGHFEVERPRQVVPMLEGLLFTEMGHQDGVDEAVNPYRVLNITGTGDGGFVYRVSFPASSDGSEFTLTRDVTPPAFQLGAIEDITHNSFYVETTTDEPALGVLWIERADVEEPRTVEHRTSSPSLIQKFPIRGLFPDTPYRFHVEFHDWAGNTAVSDWVEFTTAPRLIGESPVIHGVFPEPNATLAGPVDAIEASFDPVGGAFADGGVRLFVNLQEVTSETQLSSGGLRYAPEGGLEPGMHVVRLELLNTANATAELRWTFTVEEVEMEALSAVPVSLVLLLVMVASVVSRRVKVRA
jgi:hypothetical protein